MIKVTLKDGNIKEYENKISVKEIAESISPGLMRVALAGEVDGVLKDLRYEVATDSDINILKFDSDGGKNAYRHTSSHILAQAVKRLFPNVKLAIGPSIENGFYYDFDSEKTFLTEDIEKIENEVKKIIKENLKIEKFILSKNEAIEFMKEKKEDYKVELIADLDDSEEISFYKQGEFVDLCAGPHLMSTGQVKAMKILSFAGAYWRGNEKNKMLQRIYGTSFPKRKELDEYIEKLEEAKKRDHRKLGKELELFEFMNEGIGFPFFLNKGMILKNTLLDYWRKIHTKAGYTEISTPIILNKDLWMQSGHWSYYKENMYTTTIDENEYAIKPMNCPGGILVYKNKKHSYKEFPIKVGELGLVHRHEKSGVLHGLMRVRNFTQDDAHIYMLPDQIKDEIKNVLKLIDDVYSTFGFKYHIELSTKPEKSIGTDEEWNRAIEALKGSLEDNNIEFKINEGDGAFYGPKIDIHLEDCLGRTWQCGTIQLDFQLPQKFDLEYIGSDGEKHRPTMIHRVVFGSIERFIGILIEHFAGKFPLWISPVQVKILSISEKFDEYVDTVLNELNNNGIRVEVDRRNEKIGYKIREARNERVPYIAIIGESESKNSTISIRSRHNQDEGSINLNEFINRLKEEIDKKIIY
ncbi:MAG: threonine--tRNA ligase [Clostridiales bacterium]